MPNTCYVHDAPKTGVTTKACRRGLFNVFGPEYRGLSLQGNPYSGVGFGGTPWIDASTPTFGGSTDSFLTVGELRSKALSVVKPHEDLEPLEGNHWLRRLIENPNSVDTWFDFMYEKQMFEEMCGVYYVWKVPNRWGKTCELWVIPSHWVWPRTGGEKVPDGGVRDRMRQGGYTTYEYDAEQVGGDYARYGAKWVDVDNPYAERLIQYYEVRPWGGFGSAGVLRLPPNEVIYGRWKSPINKIDGYSTLSAIAQWIDTEESISRSRWSQFLNQARPDFWVELGPGYEDPDDDRIARMEAKFFNKFQGEGNFGKPHFSPNGTKVTPLSFTPTEMAYVGSMEEVRKSIGAAKGVPESAVGLSDSMTYGSILATLAALCSYCLNPRLNKSGQDFTKHLASEWDEKPTGHGWSSGVSIAGGQYLTRGNGGSGTSYGRRIRLFWDDMVPADPSQVNSDIETDLHGYAITPNEIRALRGRKPYRKGGDNPLVSGPSGVMPLAINAEEDSIDDIAKVIQELGKASQPDQQGQGQQPGMPGAPGQSQPGQEEPNQGGMAGLLGNQSTTEQATDASNEEEGEGSRVEDTNLSQDSAGIQNPNGKPTKSTKSGKSAKSSNDLVNLAKAYIKSKRDLRSDVLSNKIKRLEVQVASVTSKKKDASQKYLDSLSSAVERLSNRVEALGRHVDARVSSSITDNSDIKKSISDICQRMDTLYSSISTVESKAQERAATEAINTVTRIVNDAINNS